MKVDIHDAVVFVGGKPAIDADVTVVMGQVAENSCLFQMMYVFPYENTTAYVRVPFQQANLPGGRVLMGLN